MEWKPFIADVPWEHQGPTGSAGTYTGTTVIALEVHWEPWGLYWDCTQTAAAQAGIVVGALGPYWER